MKTMGCEQNEHDLRRQTLLRMNEEFLKRARWIRLRFDAWALREPYDRRSPIEHEYDREFLRQIRISAD